MRYKNQNIALAGKKSMADLRRLTARLFDHRDIIISSPLNIPASASNTMEELRQCVVLSRDDPATAGWMNLNEDEVCSEKTSLMRKYTPGIMGSDSSIPGCAVFYKLHGRWLVELTTDHIVR